MEYRIVLNRMEFRAFHGCYDLEQQVGNRFTVDLEITAELGEVASEDCVEKAVNYLLVYETVREQMRVTQRTIERVSMNIMDALYARFPQIRHIRCTGFEAGAPAGREARKSERRAGEINHTATTE